METNININEKDAGKTNLFCLVGTLEVHGG